MKKFILLASLLISNSLLANVQWSDLELYNRYTLTQNIEFSNGTTFKAGDQFDMFDFIIGGVPVIFYEMHYTGCKNPNETSEMILVDLKIEGQPDVVYGAQLSEGCNLAIFIENKDFYKQSAFTE